MALVDGVHERELALISDFYQAAPPTSGRAAAAASLERVGPLDAGATSPAAGRAESHRELFIKAAFLLAWADGQVTAAERDEDRRVRARRWRCRRRGRSTRLEAEVKDFLLRPLAGLANVEAATAVAKKLGL